MWIWIKAGLIYNSCFDLAGDKALGEIDSSIIGDLDDKTIVFHPGDCSENATSSDDFVALFKLREHLVMGFLALALWRNNQKPHTEKQKNDR